MPRKSTATKSTKAQGIHPNLGLNWHKRMTELAKSLFESEYRGETITVPSALSDEAEWLLNDILFADGNNETLKWNDDGYHPTWDFVQLKPGDLGQEVQDRWSGFMQLAIHHMQECGIPTNQFGRTAQTGDDYEQCFDKLMNKFDPANAKSNQRTAQGAHQRNERLEAEVGELKSMIRDLMDSKSGDQS